MIEKESNQEKSTVETPINPNGIKIDIAFPCTTELNDCDDQNITTAMVNGSLYVRSQNDWLLQSEVIGERGPTGATGPKGDTGTGLKIDNVYDEDDVDQLPIDGSEQSVIVCSRLYIFNKNTKEWRDVGQIKGPKGDKGDIGEQGPIGPPVSVWHGSKREYDELPTKDKQTFYMITSLL